MHADHLTKNSREKKVTESKRSEEMGVGSRKGAVLVVIEKKS